ncbi:hypothetical protein ILYODFUR_010821 [Ilyodon furcidens]|uniref:Uncharacterized protein n=1 Tax=Ilyodon furcidens TaxID=33524 RepID=A0ABV0V252_9TELE
MLCFPFEQSDPCQNTSGNSQSARRQGGTRYDPCSSATTVCRVCASSDHSTQAHCKLYRLCLNCFSPGHIKQEFSPVLSPCTQSRFKLGSPCDERGNKGSVADTLICS